MPVIFEVTLFIYSIVTLFVFLLSLGIRYDDEGGWPHELFGYALALSIAWPFMLLRSFFKSLKNIW